MGYELKDSGDRRDFGTGAVRDMGEGKGRTDLLPFHTLLELSKHFEAGAKKYEAENWRKGIPLRVYLDSALRHLFKFALGMRDERHDLAALWNVACLIETRHMIDRGILPDALANLPEWYTPHPADVGAIREAVGLPRPDEGISFLPAFDPGTENVNVDHPEFRVENAGYLAGGAYATEGIAVPGTLEATDRQGNEVELTTSGPGGQVFYVSKQDAGKELIVSYIHDPVEWAEWERQRVEIPECGCGDEGSPYEGIGDVPLCDFPSTDFIPVGDLNDWLEKRYPEKYRGVDHTEPDRTDAMNDPAIIPPRMPGDVPGLDAHMPTPATIVHAIECDCADCIAGHPLFNPDLILDGQDAEEAGIVPVLIGPDALADDAPYCSAGGCGCGEPDAVPLDLTGLTPFIVVRLTKFDSAPQRWAVKDGQSYYTPDYRTEAWRTPAALDRGRDRGAAARRLVPGGVDGVGGRADRMTGVRVGSLRTVDLAGACTWGVLGAALIGGVLWLFGVRLLLW
jgi:hypothetical protein